ncbi:hypothetical protein [Streptomyces sp. NPDC001678]|uniref:hypothetical protein n=1 Tax=Streptomyces sp. NPDC001678 TaxID=3364599 RepID=UPI0036A1E20E
MRRPAILVCAIALLSSAACTPDSAEQPRHSASASASAPASASVPVPGAAADQGATVRDAVAATLKSTARVEERTEMSGPAEMNFTVAANGEFDMAGGGGRLAAKLGMSVDATKTIPLDEIFTRDTVYFRMPEEKSGDTAWRSVSRKEAQAHYLLRPPMNDPEYTLRQAAMMRGAAKVGEESVNGKPAVRYRGKLDHEAITVRMAPDRRAKLDSGLKQMGGEIPVFADVWINHDGLIARTLLSSGMGQVRIKMTTDFTDLGKPVEPPAAPEAVESLPADMAGGPLTG